MSVQASISAEARDELIEAARHCDLESPGLGSRFLTAVEEALRQLVTYPESAPIVRRRLRRLPLRQFPYSLIYSFHDDEIRVLAVMNQKRRPFYWAGRR